MRQQSDLEEDYLDLVEVLNLVANPGNARQVDCLNEGHPMTPAVFDLGCTEGRVGDRNRYPQVNIYGFNRCTDSPFHGTDRY